MVVMKSKSMETCLKMNAFISKFKVSASISMLTLSTWKL